VRSFKVAVGATTIPLPLALIYPGASSAITYRLLPPILILLITLSTSLSFAYVEVTVCWKESAVCLFCVTVFCSVLNSSPSAFVDNSDDMSETVEVIPVISYSVWLTRLLMSAPVVPSYALIEELMSSCQIFCVIFLLTSSARLIKPLIVER